MKKPELLLPAGNLENLKTAIRYGADAVIEYLVSVGRIGYVTAEGYAVLRAVQLIVDFKNACSSLYLNMQGLLNGTIHDVADRKSHTLDV